MESIRRFTPQEQYECIVVDNASTDGTASWLQEQRDVRTITNPTNHGFTRACNQAIRQARGQHILLMHNDTIATPKWLDVMLACLESDERIGAVNPLFQASPDPSSRRWEERMTLSSACLLIRREAVRVVGLLDEAFSPGFFEDTDYSLRLRQSGYKLMVCHEATVHHMGGVTFRDLPYPFDHLKKINEDLFRKKWGFAPGSVEAKLELIAQLDHHPNERIRVLEIDCGCGADLLEIRKRFPRAELFGVESNQQVADVASQVADVQILDIERDPLHYPHCFFDYVLLPNTLEHLSDPRHALKKLLPYVKMDGMIVAIVDNIGHYQNIRHLLNGRWRPYLMSDRGRVHFFALQEIAELMNKAGFSWCDIFFVSFRSEEEDNYFVKQLCQLTQEEMKTHYLSHQYLVIGYRMEKPQLKKVKYLLRRLEHGIDIKESQQRFVQMLMKNQVYFDDVVQVIHLHIVDKAKVYMMAVGACLAHGVTHLVYPLLQKANETHPHHPDILYTLASYHIAMKEYRKALHFLEQIHSPDEMVRQQIEWVKGVMRDGSE